MMTRDKFKYCVGGVFSDIGQNLISKLPFVWENVVKLTLVVAAAVVLAVLAVLAAALIVSPSSPLYILALIFTVTLEIIGLNIAIRIKDRCDEYETTNNERSAS